MVESADIRRLLEELRFDEVERLLDNGDADAELWEEVARRRSEAEERASVLSRHLIDLGETRKYDEILDLARDPTTRTQLKLADNSTRERAERYVREAERWDARQRETHSRRLGEARKALDGLDLELARGLMRKIDGRFLSEEQNEERDQLLLDISARVMEMESLNEVGEQLTKNDRPNDKRGGQKSWWRRWLG